VFQTERGGPFTETGFAFMVSRTGAKAGLPFKAHPHMLRHACGYKLANDGHDTRAIQAWLGHRSIGNTAKYTELSATRFSNFWRWGGWMLSDRTRARIRRVLDGRLDQVAVARRLASLVDVAGRPNAVHVASLFKAEDVASHWGASAPLACEWQEVVMDDTLIVIGALITLASYLAVVVLAVWFRPWTVLSFVLGQDLDVSAALDSEETFEDDWRHPRRAVPTLTQRPDRRVTGSSGSPEAQGRDVNHGSNHHAERPGGRYAGTYPDGNLKRDFAIGIVGVSRRRE
jgi:Phage integrase family